MLISNSTAYSQCLSTTLYPANPVNASAFSDTIIVSATQHAGQYFVVSGLQLSNTYVIGSSISGDYVTVRDAANTATVLGVGNAPFSYNVGNGPSNVQVHINKISPPCGSDAVDRTTTLACSTCPPLPGGVGVNTTSPKSTLDINGILKLGDENRPYTKGMIRWNDSKSDFEGYDGYRWLSLTKGNVAYWGNGSAELTEDVGVIASDGAANDKFGTSVSISGSYAVVGAPGANSNKGAAYVFKWNGSTWVESAKLIVADGVSNDSLGKAVSISGDNIIVGAEGSQTGKGAAYIFSRVGDMWTQQAKLVANDGAAADLFGSSVSVYGDYVIVGAYKADINGKTDQGAVYFFAKVGSTWTFKQKFVDPAGESGDYFGKSVAISKSLAFVGSPGDDEYGNVDFGTVTNISHQQGIPQNSSKFFSQNNSNNTKFGSSLSISDLYFSVAAAGNGSSQNGFGLTFPHSNRLFTNAYTNFFTVGPADALGLPYGFGISISVDDFTVVGSPYSLINGMAGQGASYIYGRNVSGFYAGEWIQLTKITAADGAAGDNFGTSVGISKGSIIVGAPNKANGGNAKQGKVYFFKK